MTMFWRGFRDGYLLAYRLAALVALTFALTGCPSPIPVVDPPTPPPVGPPVNPPPVTPTHGTITDAQFSALTEWTSEAQILALVGAPFQKYDSGGFTIWVYVQAGTTKTYFLWLKAGIIDHRGTAP